MSAGLAALVLANEGPALAQQATVQNFSSREVWSTENRQADAERFARFSLHDLGSSLFDNVAPSDASDLAPQRRQGCYASPAPPVRLLKLNVARARAAYWPLVAAAECRWRLPAGLMDSVVLAESAYDPFAVSRAGAAGLSQLLPGTAHDLGVVNRFEAHANVNAGARYLRGLLDTFGGDVRLALAAYNAGPATVKRLGRTPLNGETPDYVRRVLAFWTSPGIGPMSAALSARQTAQLLGFAPTAGPVSQ